MPDQHPQMPEDPFPDEPSYALTGVGHDGQLVVHRMTADEVAAFVATAHSYKSLEDTDAE